MVNTKSRSTEDVLNMVATESNKKYNCFRKVIVLGIFGVFCALYFLSKMTPVGPHFYDVLNTVMDKARIRMGERKLDVRKGKMKNGAVKTILFVKRRPWYPKTIFNGCSHHCKLVDNLAKMKRVDAVVFLAQDLRPDNIPTKTRGQVWVFLTMESPLFVRFSLHPWRSLFNWTMHYRRDSDIPYEYGSFILKPKQKTALLGNPKANHAKNLLDHWVTKPYTAGWMVSNCRTASKRESFVQNLKPYLPVDIYGKCGRLKCHRDRNSLCWEKMNDNYQFYLSFENAICRDYLTEKIFNAVHDNFSLIPIVRGGANYHYFLPPGSYVQTSSYTNVRNLGVYLMNLRKNRSYANHFQYKQHYKAQPGSTEKFCDLCKRLHHPEIYAKYYDDINAWYRGTFKNNFCSKPKNYQ